MEFVYLWVDNYKNIKNQGFNFSPSLYCEYDREKKELVINDGDKGYTPDFFGENINITAIVGKNGSGKSSIFEILSLLYYRGNTRENDRTFFIHRKGERLCLTCENYNFIEELESFVNIKNNSKIESPKFFSSRAEMKVISFSNCISDITNSESDEAFDSLKSYPDFYNGTTPDQLTGGQNNSLLSNSLKTQHLLKKYGGFLNNETLIFDNYKFEIHISQLEPYIFDTSARIKNFIRFNNHKNKLSQRELLYKVVIVLAYFKVRSKVYNFYYKSGSGINNTSGENRFKIIEQDMDENIGYEFETKLDKKNIDCDFFNVAIEICNKYLNKVKDEIVNEAEKIKDSGFLEKMTKYHKSIGNEKFRQQSININLPEPIDLSVFNSELIERIIEKYKLIKINNDDQDEFEDVNEEKKQN
ncbi:MAG: AAA family ATPase, partial [Endozoicomonadaceae bacterium]|nr:AAA family ATPase [Endozoicomonadaceae bacterium]